MPGYFIKGTEKNLKCAVFPVIIIQNFYTPQQKFVCTSCTKNGTVTCIWSLTPHLEILRSESWHLYSLHVRYNLLNHLNLFFPPWLKICICPFRKDPACFLPASVRFWLDNFLVLAATTTAAAGAEGWMYFASVTVRKFTKITTIWFRIIYNFTYPIVSDKHFLWSIFWTT